jgi:DTW domain-containing protein YfiP
MSHAEDDDEAHNDHSAQWERQGEWLTKLRTHKESLQQQGVRGWDLLEAMATLSLNHKIQLVQDTRCPRCWHDPLHCICSQLMMKPTTTLTNLHLCILMHHKEYLGAGNSAKLLLQLLPQHTTLYLFGKQGDVDRLQQDIAHHPSFLLWPSETATSVAEYKTTLKESHSTTVYAVVLDGTYTQARNMYKSLRKRWSSANHLPPTVAVNPTMASVFHRAQKNYGQAQLQAQADVLRVSTAEACGFLWREWSHDDDESILESILQAVVVNNDALAFARKSH